MMKKNFSKILNENVDKINMNEAPTNYIEYYRKMYNRGYKSDEDKADERDEKLWQRNFDRQNKIDQRNWNNHLLTRGEYLDDLKTQRNREDFIHDRDRQEKIADLATIFRRNRQLTQDAHSWYMQKGVFDTRDYTVRKAVDYQDFKNRLYDQEFCKDQDENRRNKFELDKLDKQNQSRLDLTRLNNQNKYDIANLKSSDYQFKVQKDFDREMDKQLKNKEIEFNKSQKKLDEIMTKINQENTLIRTKMDREDAIYKKLNRKPSASEITRYTQMYEDEYKQVLIQLLPVYTQISNAFNDVNLSEDEVVSQIAQLMEEINTTYRNAYADFHRNNPEITTWANHKPDVWPATLHRK